MIGPALQLKSFIKIVSLREPLTLLMKQGKIVVIYFDERYKKTKIENLCKRIPNSQGNTTSGYQIKVSKCWYTVVKYTLMKEVDFMGGI